MDRKKINKEEGREFEKGNYSSELFWQDKIRQPIIEKILQKIYDLQDEIELIKDKKI